MRNVLRFRAQKVSAPIVESLENRQMFALATVHQELHRPPTMLTIANGTPPLIVEPTVGLQLSLAGLLNGPVFGFDVYSSDGKGSYRVTGQFDADEPAPGIDIDSALAVGDLNGDGLPDVALKLFSVTGQITPVGETVDERIVPFYNTGKGTFVRGVKIPVGESFTFSFAGRRGYDYYRAKSDMAIADVDGDGVGDIVSWTGSNTTTILMDRFSNGPRQTTSVDIGPFTSDDSRILGLADLDGDGRTELIGFDGTSNSVIVRGWDPKQKKAIIGVASPKDLAGPVTDVRVGDFNGDGHTDLSLFSGSRYSIGINVTKTHPTGISPPVYGFSWGTTQTLSPQLTVNDVGAGDVNTDGSTDLFVLQDRPKAHLSIIK